MRIPGWIVLLSLVAPCAAQVANGIRAIVNHSIVTDFQLQLAAGNALELLRARYGTRPEEFRKKAAETLQNALDQMIERRLIIDEFERQKYFVPESVIDDALRTRIREMYGGDRAALLKSLQMQGLTLERLRQQIKEQIIVSAMVQKNVAASTIISPQKILRYYETNKEQYRLEEQIKLHMIMLDGSVDVDPAARLQLAVNIKTKLREGMSFDELAGMYNTPGLRSRKGDWGWAEKSGLLTGLAEMAFGLPVGVPSPIIGYAKEGDDYWIFEFDDKGTLTIAKKYGIDKETNKENRLGEFAPDALPESAPKAPEILYILLVKERKPGGYKPLEEVQTEIEQTLLVQERARLQKKWIDKLRARSFVRYF